MLMKVIEAAPPLTLFLSVGPGVLVPEECDATIGP